MNQHSRWVGAVYLALSLASPCVAHGPIHERIARVNVRLERSPEDAALLVERALLHREHRDLSAARTDLTRAITLDPKFLPAKSALATVLLESGEIEAALRTARAVIAIEPAHPGATRVEARAQVALGKYASAIEAFDRVIAALERPSPDLILERFRAARAAEPDAPTAALEGLDHGIERIGPVVSLILPAVELERELGEFDSALHRVKILREQAGRPTPWLVLESEILLEAKRWPRAARRAEEAIRLLDEGSRKSSKANVRLRTRAARVVAAAQSRGES